MGKYLTTWDGRGSVTIMIGRNIALVEISKESDEAGRGNADLSAVNITIMITESIRILQFSAF